jgi:hypothetical protein
LAFGLLYLFDMFDLFALAIVCGAGVFFMLVFLRALSRDTTKPPIHFTSQDQTFTATVVSIENNPNLKNRAA